MKSITVVVPAFNEDRTVEAVVESVLRELRKYCVEYEVIVLDDGSNDFTGNIVDRLGRKYEGEVRVYKNKSRRGIAYTLERLFSLARMDYILDIPGDGQISASVIGDISSTLERYDIVVCKRRKKLYGMYRGVISFFYRWLTRFLFGMDLYDPGCAKCMRREIRQRGGEISRGVFIEAERCIRAVNDSYRLGKVDVDLSWSNKGNGTGGRVWLVLEAVYDMMRFWWYWQVFRGKEVSGGRMFKK